MPLNIPDYKPGKRIVIVGGGFGGLALVKLLSKLPVQVVLIDKNNHHVFQPLLYQLATAGLDMDAIAYPLRQSLRRWDNTHFRLASVKRVIPDANKIITCKGDISYDFLVLATGALANFFGMDNLKQKSHVLKTLEDALNLRSRLFKSFEENLTEPAGLEDGLLNITIVGGGPTGVELAGALGDLKNGVLKRDYGSEALKGLKINLLEAGSRVLPALHAKSSEKARSYLESLGVNVRTNTRVLDYDGEWVKTGEDVYQSKTLIWAAGVKGGLIKGIDPEKITKNRRIKVDAYNRVEGYNNLFAIGDIACMISELFPNGHPMLAQVAIQQAHHVGKNFKRMIKQKELRPFQYKEKGVMATIGRKRAVIEVSGFKLQGWLAWFIWMTVHLCALIGFRNKLLTFFNWASNYITHSRNTRFIIFPAKENNT